MILIARCGLHPFHLFNKICYRTVSRTGQGKNSSAGSKRDDNNISTTRINRLPRPTVTVGVYSLAAIPLFQPVPVWSLLHL